MTTELDQFFTPEGVALQCWNWLLAQPGIVTPDRFYIEPSAGRGAFLRLLPMGSRAGYEIDHELVAAALTDVDLPPIAQQDYLALRRSAQLPDDFIAVGNPPFGRRGKQAVKFINHSFALGAAYVAFILPPAFKAEAGGEPPITERQIKGGYSIAELPVPTEFELPEGGSKDISGCAFILYKRGARPSSGKPAGPLFAAPGDLRIDDYITLYIVRKGSNEDRQCDVYLPRRYYAGQSPAPSTERSHDDMVGVVIHRDRDRIKGFLLAHDWAAAAPQSVNGSINLNYARIKKAVEEMLAARRR